MGEEVISKITAKIRTKDSEKIRKIFYLYATKLKEKLDEINDKI